MRLTERLEYPATTEDVFAMFCDRAFREQVCQETGALSWSVEVDASSDTAGDGASVTVRRVMPAEVPAAVKRFLGETVEVVQTEQWESADGDHRRAEVLIEIEGQPAKMIGTVTLEPDGETSALVLDGEIKVRVPLVGSRLEKEVARAVTGGLRVEQRVGRGYLAA